MSSSFSLSPLCLTISTCKGFEPTGGLKVCVGGYIVEVEVEGEDHKTKPVVTPPPAAVEAVTEIFELEATETVDPDSQSARSAEAGAEWEAVEVEFEILDTDMPDAPALEESGEEDGGELMDIDSEYWTCSRAGPVEEAWEFEEDLDFEEQLRYQDSALGLAIEEHEYQHEDSHLDSVLNLLGALTLTNTLETAEEEEEEAHEPEVHTRKAFRRPNKVTKRSSSSSSRFGKTVISRELMTLIQNKAEEKHEVEVSMNAFASTYQVRIL